MAAIATASRACWLVGRFRSGPDSSSGLRMVASSAENVGSIGAVLSAGTCGSSVPDVGTTTPSS
eukprot:125259-Prymnesium_polylepis.3